LETLRRNLRELDYTLIGVLLLLAVYSCVALLATTYGKTVDVTTSHLLPRQILFEVLGFVAMFVVMAMDYRSVRKVHWWFYVASILLLVVVFKMPLVNGAHSWIPLPVFALQPSEFAKMALIITLATRMATVDEQEFPSYGMKNSWQVWALCLVPFVLTLKEPALGQALVMFAITGCMYMVFTKRSYFSMMIAVIALIVCGTTVVANQYPKQSASFIENVLVKDHVLKSYQADRIITWLDPSYNNLNEGYNIHQAQVAVGSGQLFGEGLFNGISTRGGWVPNQTTDYIFTAIGEEFGFVGSSVLVLLFLILIYRLIKVAGTSQDTFGTYLIMGICGMFAFQVFENVGMDMYLSPSTGITLPFISYGGSSLIVNYMAIGLVMSVSLRRKKLRFS
jgi:rod shape determining protein RodA